MVWVCSIEEDFHNLIQHWNIEIRVVKIQQRVHVDLAVVHGDWGGGGGGGGGLYCEALGGVESIYAVGEGERKKKNRSFVCRST